VGPGSEQLAAASVPIANLAERFDPNSLGDLAAVLMNVDLVVTVETAVAHLAGALGVPVWVMLSVAGDWRWLLERSDSPWYPTMRLFRQQRFGDWEDVFERVVAEVKTRLNALSPAPTNT
jgi:ADP-heptose:LPS heptosyltransferase